jgi:hypothetical protein
MQETVKPLNRKFSPQRLLNRRRMNAARRFWRDQPLFAFSIMKSKYPDYTEPQFVDDLRRRTPFKKQKGKSNLRKYGRFNRMQALLTEYAFTGKIECAIEAIKLRKRLSKPYQVRVILKRVGMDYMFPPETSLLDIEEFARAARNCRTWDEINELEKKLREFSHLG